MKKICSVSVLLCFQICNEIVVVDRLETNGNKLQKDLLSVYKRLIRVKEVTAKQVRLRILSSRLNPTYLNIGCINYRSSYSKLKLRKRFHYIQL